MALIGEGLVMEVEVGGRYLSRTEAPVGQVEMTTDNEATPDLRRRVMRGVEIGIIKETIWGI